MIRFADGAEREYELKNPERTRRRKKTWAAVKEMKELHA